MNKFKTYSELITIPSFEDRFNYLALGGNVGIDTFGWDRYLNQVFYNSPEWKKIRREVMIRDNGCDMGLDGFPIGGKIIIHHMNPIESCDILDRDISIMDPEFLVCVSHRTHNAIHYGSFDLIKDNLPFNRTPNDTCPWKKGAQFG